ncbi:hypothetical protein GCM10010219_52290 [Streptomyces netropsis]|nr:hypothetical protein GCM10010219_52290 [Streptomyces netropsis]
MTGRHGAFRGRELAETVGPDSARPALKGGRPPVAHQAGVGRGSRDLRGPGARNHPRTRPTCGFREASKRWLFPGTPWHGGSCRRAGRGDPARGTGPSRGKEAVVNAAGRPDLLPVRVSP